MTTATAIPVTQTQTARYAIDGSHSTVGFSVRHMMITNVRGQFEDVSGEIAYDPSRPEATAISATIGVASIHTREDKRDAHLRSADFFDVERYPTMTFQSKRARRKGERLEVVGDLTIRGTTREVTLTIEDVTAEHKDPWGNRRLGASARTTIRRSDYGMTWNAALEAGGVLVGDEITIQLDVSLVKQPA